MSVCATASCRCYPTLITGKAGVAQTLLSVLVMLAKPENIDQVTVITSRRDDVYGRIRDRALT